MCSLNEEDRVGCSIWGDGEEYPGTVREIVHERGFATQVIVDFDDGDSHKLNASDLQRIEVPGNIDEQNGSVDDSRCASEVAGQCDERDPNFSSPGNEDCERNLRAPGIFSYLSKEAEDIAWDWVNYGYADIKTAHDLALMGRTVQEFNNDLLAAKRDNEELDWECFKATFLGVGAWAKDYGDSCKRLQIINDAALAWAISAVYHDGSFVLCCHEIYACAGNTRWLIYFMMS